MQRGLVGVCKGPKKLSGGSAYTARKRLKEGFLPVLHPLVAFGPSEAPSVETRGRFSRHFGEAPGGAAAAPRALRVVPFSKQAVAPRLGLDSVLLAFGFSSREEAEEL
eukprot:9482054-Pyramimonas_sp.AAC.1